MPINERNNSSSRSSFDPTDETINNVASLSAKRDTISSSSDVRPDKVTTTERNLLSPSIGEIVHNTDVGENEYWNGSQWIGEGAAAPTDLDGRIIVNQANFSTTLGGVIDSSKEYFIDGVVDCGDTSIVVPIGGINIKGYSFDLSALLSTQDNYTLFKSETPQIGSGIVIIRDLTISINGAGSQVYALVDADGSNGISVENVYYVGCSSLGELAGFRQGVENNTLRVGGSPSLTFSGLWTGGYRATSTIARDLAGTMTSAIFKEGLAFQMNSRFLTDINADLPTLAPLCDFTVGNFNNPSTMQLKGAIVTRDGIFNANDSNIFSNLSASDLACDWDANIGVKNTFIGGGLNNTSEVQTTIVTQGAAVDLNGTFASRDLQHFDSPSNGRLRHIGTNPTDFLVSWDFLIDGKDNDNYELFLIKIDSLANVTVEYTQVRTVNNFQGGRDVGIWSGTTPITLNQNDVVFWQIANLLDDDNCTLEIDSTWTITER